MTDEPTTVDERIAARKADEERIREQLANVQLDGPHDLSQSLDTFSALSAMFGGIRNRYAICLRCGSIVVLNDPEERTDGPPIERGVRLHLAWHDQLEATR